MSNQKLMLVTTVSARWLMQSKCRGRHSKNMTVAKSTQQRGELRSISFIENRFLVQLSKERETPYSKWLSWLSSWSRMFQANTEIFSMHVINLFLNIVLFIKIINLSWVENVWFIISESWIWQVFLGLIICPLGRCIPDQATKCGDCRTTEQTFTIRVNHVTTQFFSSKLKEELIQFMHSLMDQIQYVVAHKNSRYSYCWWFMLIAWVFWPLKFWIVIVFKISDKVCDRNELFWNVCYLYALKR